MKLKPLPIENGQAIMREDADGSGRLVHVATFYDEGLCADFLAGNGSAENGAIVSYNGGLDEGAVAKAIEKTLATSEIEIGEPVLQTFRALAKCADDFGLVEMSQTELAKRTGTTGGTVHNHLGKLRRAGYITMSRPGHATRPAEYQVTKKGKAHAE